MAKLKLKPCPFCGESVEPNDTTLFKLEKCWVVSHYCPALRRASGELGPTMDVYGSTKAEAVEFWNTRNGEG